MPNNKKILPVFSWYGRKQFGQNIMGIENISKQGFIVNLGIMSFMLFKGVNLNMTAEESCKKTSYKFIERYWSN